MQTPLPVLQPQSWVSCWNQFSRHLRRLLDERFALVNLPETSALVLEALATVNVHLTQSDLARELNISESNLCGLVERMRRDGLLQRERSWKDRRKSVLTLTAVGEELHRTVNQIHRELGEQVLSGFSSEQQQQFSELMSLLLRHQLATAGSPEPSLRRIAS